MIEKSKSASTARKIGMGLLQEWPLLFNLATTQVFLVYGQGLLSNLAHPVWFTLITAIQPGYCLFLTYTLLALFLTGFLTRKPKA
jgi:hypothetical protein